MKLNDIDQIQKYLWQKFYKKKSRKEVEQVLKLVVAIVELSDVI